MSSARSLLLLAGTLLCAQGAQAQEGWVVAVLSAATGSPIEGAAVRCGAAGGGTVFTDRLGRARLPESPRPCRLLVAAIGFRPETLSVDGADRLVTVRLTPETISLATLTVRGDIPAALTPSAAGIWTLPADAIRTQPVAVEPDPFRALAAVPSVTFSSLLSARPIINGYDAAESVVRLDGFELLNPYHIGRIFSAIPADALESVSVESPPARSAESDALAGVVDLTGRSSGGDDRPIAGAQLSLAAASAWYGSPRPFPLFVAGRAAFVADVTRLVGEEIPYRFRDAYARARIGLGSTRSVDGVLYLSNDDLGHASAGHGMEWSNALAGSRWRILDGPAGSLDVRASANWVASDGRDIAAGNSDIDVSSEFRRFSVGLDGATRLGPGTLSAGASADLRRIAQWVTRRAGDDFPAFSDTSEIVTGHLYASMLVAAPSASADVGLRLDASQAAASVQPRMRFVVMFGSASSASLTLARTARLHQVVTDAQAEPTISFTELWFAAGKAGVPVPEIDHFAVQWDKLAGPVALHAAGFASSGRGLGELRPNTDQHAGLGPYRFGSSRTRGIQVRAAWQPASPGGLSAALSYVWSRSERRWEDGIWRPWRLDRRHAVRASLQGRLTHRLRAFGAAELLSGQAMTPVRALVQTQLPPRPASGASLTRLAYQFGPEGSARSAGTFHLDVGVEGGFREPGGARISVNLSVLNIGFGPVAPEEPASPYELLPGSSFETPPSSVPYRRRFDLPAVPSLSLRVEF